MTRTMKTVGPRPSAFACLLLVVMVPGCSGLYTEYGKSRGTSGRRSINGFGALRSAYERGGFRDRDVSRLSDRVARTDVIVWTPQVLQPIPNNVTGWFDRWLRRGDKTLVYIVPDSGSESDYWIDAGKKAPPPQRLEYRRRAAKSVNQRMVWRINRKALKSNGWFGIEPTADRQLLGTVSGPWSETVNESDEAIEQGSEFRIVAFDSQAPTTPPATPNFAGPTGPGPAGFSFTPEPTPTSTPIEFESLLANEAGDPIVAELRSDRWGSGSKVIVVSGGSLLTNYAFTRPFSRRLADEIVIASKPPNMNNASAGFLSSSWTGIPVSERKSNVPQNPGWGPFQWPLSILTSHGLVLGLVVLLMIWPVFGRPRRVQQTRHSNFGDHLDAVAALMKRANGEKYARARISEYMKRIHKETSGPWVLPDPIVPQQPLWSPTQPASKPTPTSSAAEPNRPRPTSSSATPKTSSGGGSLLDQALSEEERSPARPATAQPTASRPDTAPRSDTAPTAKTTPTPSNAPGSSAPDASAFANAPAQSMWAVCEQAMRRRLADEYGIQGGNIDKGVTAGPLHLRRLEGNIVRLSQSSMLCMLVMGTSSRGKNELRDVMSGSGSSPQEAIGHAIDAYMDLVFPCYLGLVDRRISPDLSSVPGWELHMRAVRVDTEGWLSERLGLRSVLDWIPQSIGNLAARRGLHRMSVLVSNGTSSQMQVECYVDGTRSADSENELRREISRGGPVGGVWELRQFFTMRPRKDT